MRDICEECERYTGINEMIWWLWYGNTCRTHSSASRRGLQLYVKFSEPEKAIWVYDWLSGNNIQVADTGNYTLDTAATSDFIVLGFANTDE